MRIIEDLKKEAIIASLNSKNKDGVIRELTNHISSVYPNFNTDTAYETIIEREKLCSTALDAGVAIPHGKMSGLTNFITVFGRSIGGIDFESLDNKPTHLFFLILSPENSSGLHLKVLAKISKIFKIPEFRSKLLAAKDIDEIHELIADEDAKY